jgi:FkbM family methyltransferase
MLDTEGVSPRIAQAPRPRSPRGVASRVGRVLRDTGRATRLGASPKDRAEIAILMLAAPVRRRKAGRPRERRLGLTTPEGPIRWTVGGDADLKAFLEVMVDGSYEVPVLTEPQTIVDIGSHVGTSILRFRIRFPHARIIGFEPDPHNFRKLQANVGHLPGVELHQLALASTDGPVSFYSSGAHDSWASSTLRTRPWQVPVEVEGQSLATVFRRLAVDQVDLMKIDIEGGEFVVLQDEHALSHVRAIVGEVHPEGPRTIERFREILREFDSTLPTSATRPVIFFAHRPRRT